jgi:F-type H+-transporting ATPase subunit epsilon
MALILEIITPDGSFYNGTVTSATFPGALGIFQVLNNHAPIISALDKGLLSYVNEEGKHSFEIDGGVVEVLKNKITVLAESIK